MIGIAVLEFWYHLLGMPAVTIKLSGEDYQLLKAEAERRGTTQSELLRDGLRRVTSERESNSIADRMQDIVGSINGPVDLAANKDHLKNYGS